MKKAFGRRARKKAKARLDKEMRKLFRPSARSYGGHVLLAHPLSELGYERLKKAVDRAERRVMRTRRGRR